MSAAAEFRSPRSLRQQELRTLVLNADARPLGTWPLNLISARKAVEKVWQEKVVVVDTWEDAFYHSEHLTIGVPKVIMLRQFRNIYGKPKFCRRSILLRDGYKCQYCGNDFESAELTEDHVVPRSKGGKTEWTNIVAACIDCNAKKQDGDAMRPLRKPWQPTNMELLQAGLRLLPNDIRETWGSWLYWTAELTT